MLPPGFLGTRADVLMDLVVVSFAIILPALYVSWKKARGGAFVAHKRIQVTLFSVLVVVVSLFEVDLRMAGGIFEMTRESIFAGTPLLNGSIWFHTTLSILTSLAWIGLVIVSVRRFPSPPRPSAFSAAHRRWGRLAMIGMGLTGITGIELYVLGFMF
jgi:uncharacterized membrane protein YozB (DUF420 family)